METASARTGDVAAVDLDRTRAPSARAGHGTRHLEAGEDHGVAVVRQLVLEVVRDPAAVTVPEAEIRMHRVPRIVEPLGGVPVNASLSLGGVTGSLPFEELQRRLGVVAADRVAVDVPAASAIGL